MVEIDKDLLDKFLDSNPDKKDKKLLIQAKRIFFNSSRSKNQEEIRNAIEELLNLELNITDENAIEKIDSFIEQLNNISIDKEKVSKEIKEAEKEEIENILSNPQGIYKIIISGNGLDMINKILSIDKTNFLKMRLESGKTILQVAIESNRYNIINLLLKDDIDYKNMMLLKDTHGNSILHYIVIKKDINLLNKLRDIFNNEEITTLNEANYDRFTPLDMLKKVFSLSKDEVKKYIDTGLII